MITIVIAVHIVICITLVIVVLLQQGKGADVGAVFGGSSSTVFGATGAGNVLTKVTWACAAVFFATSIILAYASARRVTGSIFEGGAPRPAQTAPFEGTENQMAPPATGAPSKTHSPPSAPVQGQKK